MKQFENQDDQIPELYRLALRIQTEFRSMGLTVKLDERRPPQLLEKVFDLSMQQLDKYMLEFHTSQRNQLQMDEAPRWQAKLAGMAEGQKRVAAEAETKRAAAEAEAKRVAAEAETKRQAVEADTKRAAVETEAKRAAAAAEAKRQAAEVEAKRVAAEAIEKSAFVDREQRANRVKESISKVIKNNKKAAGEIENIKLTLEDIGKNNPFLAIQCVAAINKIQSLYSGDKRSYTNDKKILELVREMLPELKKAEIPVDDDVVNYFKKRGISVTGAAGGYKANGVDMLSAFSSSLDQYLKSTALHEIEIKVKKIGVTGKSHVLKKITAVLEDTSMGENKKQEELIKIATAAQSNVLNRPKNIFFGPSRGNEKNGLYQFIIDNLRSENDSKLTLSDPERGVSRPGSQR